MKTTPKQRVLKRWPGAKAHQIGNGWHIYAPSKPNRIEVEIGNGMTASEAWADADKRTTGDGER